MILLFHSYLSTGSFPDIKFILVLGDGVGIEPESGEVAAPFDGEISSVTDTRHAIGISGPGGMEIKFRCSRNKFFHFLNTIQ